MDMLNDLLAMFWDHVTVWSRWRLAPHTIDIVQYIAAAIVVITSPFTIYKPIRTLLRWCARERKLTPDESLDTAEERAAFAPDIAALSERLACMEQQDRDQLGQSSANGLGR